MRREITIPEYLREAGHAGPISKIPISIKYNHP